MMLMSLLLSLVCALSRRFVRASALQTAKDCGGLLSVLGVAWWMWRESLLHYRKAGGVAQV